MAEHLTPAQAEYLCAFDDLLGSRTFGEGLRARRRMGVVLNYVCAEAGLNTGRDTRWRDSLFER
jgi:hypothetical protein